MNIGDLVKAIWSDGTEVVGVYIREERGYIILRDKSLRENPCNKHTVAFEIVNAKNVIEETII